MQKIIFRNQPKEARIVKRYIFEKKRIVDNFLMERKFSAAAWALVDTTKTLQRHKHKSDALEFYNNEARRLFGILSEEHPKEQMNAFAAINLMNGNFEQPAQVYLAYGEYNLEVQEYPVAAKQYAIGTVLDGFCKKDSKKKYKMNKYEQDADNLFSAYGQDYYIYKSFARSVHRYSFSCKNILGEMQEMQTEIFRELDSMQEQEFIDGNILENLSISMNSTARRLENMGFGIAAATVHMLVADMNTAEFVKSALREYAKAIDIFFETYEISTNGIHSYIENAVRYCQDRLDILKSHEQSL